MVTSKRNTAVIQSAGERDLGEGGGQRGWGGGGRIKGGRVCCV